MHHKHLLMLKEDIMDITSLEYFKMIAECGSLTKAAKKLHITQPAMSAMLHKLEQELQVELFNRTSNRIYLNQAGEVALIHINSILRNVEILKKDVQAIAKKNQSLNIAFCDPGVRWFTIPRFQIANPEVEVDDDLYENDDCITLLKERVYDLMITPYKIKDANINSNIYIKDQVYLSVPKNNILANKLDISIKEIPQQALLYPEIGGYFLSQIEKLIKGNNLPITLIKNNYNVTQHLIRTTNFLATISNLSKDLRNDGSHRILIPFNDNELKVTYYCSYLKNNYDKVKIFLEWSKKSHKS